MRRYGGVDRARRNALTIVGVVALLTWPFLNPPFSVLGTAIQACIITIVAVSLVLLIGWVGQISLAHAAFVGIGAFSTGLVTRGWGVAFPLSLVFAAVISAAVAAALGVVALRVRGLYLAVATLIFAWIADQYLFRSSWLVGAGGSSVVDVSPIGREGAIPFFDLAERRSLYYVVLAVAAAAIYAAANIRDSKTGRAFFAVRGSEMAAASLGIDVRRYKLMAFAVSGFLAGAAGNLVMISQGSAVPAQFAFKVSLFYLAVAVVGGLTSLPGGVAAAVLFAGLSEVFFRVRALAGWLEVVTAALLAVVLLAYPGGLAAVPGSLRGPWRAVVRRGRTVSDAVGRRLDRPWRSVRGFVGGAARAAGAISSRLADRMVSLLGRRRDRPTTPERERRDRETGAETRWDAWWAVAKSPWPFSKRATPRTDVLAVPMVESHVTLREPDAAGELDPTRLRGRDAGAPAVLEADNVVVRFGGLVAADHVSVAVHEGEIVGLIGPNGAGKTTTFNAISGLNLPAEGTIRLLGRDVTSEDVHRRAARGLGRTFQVIQLFSQLTVFDNLLVATHLQNPTGLFSHLVVSAPSLMAEDRARQRVRQAVALLGLEEVADRRVGGLPFGVLRLVELARAVVTGAPVVMLDEPASGLDNAETDRLAELLYFVRDELGVSLLLIEHDVRMVTSVSDYMYVIDRGKPLAEGKPADVQRNDAVISAYLGDATAEVS